jgi:hypothetical protein
MTTTDRAKLCERLRAALEGVTPSRWVSSGTSVEVFRGGTLFTSYRGNGKFEDATFIALSREAVPSLLDTLERQAAEIERLLEALRFYADHPPAFPPSEGPWGVNSNDFGNRARAALTGEDA